MNKKEKIALLIGLKDRINQNQLMTVNLRNKVTSLLSEAINESSKKETEGLALNNIIGKVVNDLNLMFAFEGLKLTTEAEIYWKKLVEIDIDRRRDLSNSSFIAGGISSLH
ncbi:hypothetical protein ACTPGR_000179 [Enterococcus hirae]